MKHKGIFCSNITTFLALGFHMVFHLTEPSGRSPCRRYIDPSLTRILGQGVKFTLILLGKALIQSFWQFWLVYQFSQSVHSLFSSYLLFPPLNTPCYSIFLLSSWEFNSPKSIKGTKSGSISFKVRYLQVKQGRYEYVIQTSLSSFLGVNKPKLNKTTLKCFETTVKAQNFDFFFFNSTKWSKRMYYLLPINPALMCGYLTLWR